jgi:hypothetical protein
MLLLGSNCLVICIQKGIECILSYHSYQATGLEAEDDAGLRTHQSRDLMEYHDVRPCHEGKLFVPSSRFSPELLRSN